MRQHRRADAENTFSILTLDDDPIMTLTIQAYFQRAGYTVDAENDPTAAIERIRSGHYDILLLDYLMEPLCGDQVVEQIRQFNKDIYIVLLTGHKDMAPPVKTIRALDIQGYFEKSERFDQLELLVESCVKSIKQLRTIRSYKDGLSAIATSAPEIYDLSTPDRITGSIMRTVSTLLPCRSVLLMLRQDWDRTDLAGAPGEFISCALGENTAVPAAQTAADMLLALQGKTSLVQGQQVTLPITDSEQTVFGYLCAGLQAAPGYDQIQLLEVFSRQVSAALSNMRLHALLQASNRQLSSAYDSLQSSYMEMIGALRLAVDAKDPSTCGHSDRVAFYASEIANAMGRDRETCERVRIAGLFHDVGKLSIPDSILLKPTNLTDEEYRIIQSHPRRGVELLAGITKLQPILPAVLSHHERLDGSGYPDGLQDGQIPEDARIIAVADAFDAMTADRRYHKATPVTQALSELDRLRGVTYDATAVGILRELVERHGLWDRMHNPAESARGSQEARR